ncbi:D-inositol 3-phosphate glycosyltransferase [Aquisphaera giovannonii]|uniref:D-inositol 3-phosphate glycosyltransferase n=1 Tax=Aquisphaera giovannonii TaxID=406548 RepID=A0A5B9WED7_9BACT|nr:glycosyltransferase family 4 protein [Aquisphaera giovannonii]QEH38331.1 D-inositol 3-phosphate glycosyltransferase [Aquisphaera giovannonii]
MSQHPEKPLRIALLVSYFHPFASGAERQALAQGVELVRRGHTVHVVTRSVPGYPIDDEEYRGVSIHRWIRTWDRGPLFAVSFVRGAIRALARLRAEIDLVHTHQGLWEAVATGLGRRRLRGLPALVQPASAGYYGEADELGRTRGAAVLRRLILRNTAFAAISAEIERQWLQLGVPPGRMVRTASGVDADHFRPGPSAVEGELLPRPRVLFTGRLHPQKNLPMLLEAWAVASRRVPGSLILLGPGEDREALRALSEGLGLAGRVQLAGPVADPADYLRAADLFVLPSVAEGMSNSLLEAMATGLPCLASGIGGNVDLIADRVTGRLVAEPTPSAWSDALVEVLSDPEAATRMGAAARSRIEARYALPAVVDRYVSIYRDMIAGRWPGADARLP